MSLEAVESGEDSFGGQDPSSFASSLVELMQSPIPNDPNTTYYQAYRRAFIKFSLSNISGLDITTTEAATIVNNIECMMESIVLPSIYEREKGLKDYPSTTATDTVVVNGIEMSTFTKLFDYVFIDRQYVSSEVNQAVEQLAEEINSLGWKDNEDVKKELFSSLCSINEISSLFYYALASSPELRYSLALFAVDPCIAYLFLQWGFETLPQGGSFFKTCKIDELFANQQLPFSPNPVTTEALLNNELDPVVYPTLWSNLKLDETVSNQDGFAKFALYAIVQRDSWIHSITSPESGQQEYREAWRTRLFGSKTSQLNTLCRINEKYNLNVENDLTLSDSDQQSSVARGSSYQKIFEKLNYKELVGGGSVEMPEIPLAQVVEEAPPISIGGITPVGGGGGGGGGAAQQDSDPTATQEALAAGGGGVLPGAASAPTLGDVGISLSQTDGKGKKNDYTGPQILLNSGRIILNAEEHLMLFGANGATLSSPNRINIDSNETITLFGEEGLFLGIPNKGAPIEKKSEITTAAFANKLPEGQFFEASATGDNESGYEPLVLGDKLANFLDDLLFTLINATSLNPTGTGVWREDTTYHLRILLARVPEMLSTYAFIDGISHEEPRPFPTAPSSLSKSGGAFDPNSVVGKRLRTIEQRQRELEAQLAAQAAARNNDPLSSLPGYYESQVNYPTDQW